MTRPIRSWTAAPAWARACDVLSGLLVLLAIWIALTGGSRHLVFDTVISLRSALLFLYAAGGILAVRHLLAPSPSVVDGLRGADAAIAARPALAAALRPTLATRLLVLTVAFFAVVTIGFPPGRGDLRVSKDPLINLPARYDAGWYGTIALDGYSWGHTFSRQQDIAFFPALPMLSRTVAGAFGLHMKGLSREARAARVLWSAVLLSFAGLLVGLWYLVKVGEDSVGPERAAAAALLLAAYPFSLFYSAPYTEGMFLAAAVGAWFHFTRGQWIAASLWGLLAGLARPNGCFLSIPLGLLALQHVHAARAARTGGGWPMKETITRLAVAAMPGIGMLIYTAYLHQLTGVWFAWARSHAAWGRTFQGFAPFGAALERLRTEPLVDVIAQAPYESLNTLGLLFGVVLLWPTFRRIGAAWGVFVLVNLASPLMAGGVLSMGRLTSTLFPLFLALAAVLPPRAVPACAAAFALLQGLCAALFFTWRDLY